MALSKEELVLSESDLSFMVSFFYLHSAKSVYALKMLDVVILKLVFFFLLLVYVAGSKVSKQTHQIHLLVSLMAR